MFIIKITSKILITLSKLISPIMVKLVSSAKTGHYYTTTKNKNTSPDKMESKKFDPVVRKHVIYKESKIK